ncbi:uncharacterized protein [Primulina eburnea]|uniref:uncharacterized protein n=1 Tax=Primulina eburnea TaxID=1245227 RepID=UPI003C6C8B84
MVFFKDISSSSGVQSLVILDDESQSEEKDTILAIDEPVAGRYAKPWPRLTNPFYTDEWSIETPFNKTSKVWILRATHHQQPKEHIHLSSLGRRIIEDKATWDDTLRFTGEFHYIKGYWEWTEDILSRCDHKLRAAQIYDPVYASLFTYDRNTNIMKAFCEAWCPANNTLLTSLGELSISLWDLHSLSGLPITGHLYDEVVPSAKELTGVDEAGSRFFPRSCNYLFHAYHLLRGSSKGEPHPHVTIDQWVRFWFKKSLRYHSPPPRKDKKTVRPKSTHNPLGDLNVHESWSIAEKAIFSKLGIKDNSIDETYLAAYLSCWLCAFILPFDDANTIRPSTFKIANIMANGRKVGLAVPTLTSIYRGLNKIVGSSNPSQVSSTFPVHFIYGWLAHYFKTHFQVWQGVRSPKMASFSGEGGAKYYDPSEARKKIHKEDFVSWTCTMITRNKDFLYLDNGNAEEFEQNYFIAIRSSYLSLRQGGHFIIEPYSPHRFSRQFGFYQTIPGVLTRDIRRASLEDGLLYWRLCVLSNSMSKVRFPSIPPNAKKFCSDEYKKWWAAVHGNYLEENIMSLTVSYENSQEGKVCDNGDDFLGEDPLHMPSNTFLKEHNVRAIELPTSNKRKNLEDSESSNADCHWKRTKKDSDPSNQKIIDIDCATRDEQHTGSFVGELEHKLLNDDIRGSQDSQKSLAILSAGDTISKKSSISTMASVVPKPVALAVFDGGKFLFDHQKDFLQRLWMDLREKITNTSVDCISSLKDDVFLVLGTMKSLNGFDFSGLEELLGSLFDKAAAFGEACTRSSEETAKEALAQQLSEAKDRLDKAKTKEIKEASQVKSTQEDLERTVKELGDLKEAKETLIFFLEETTAIVFRCSSRGSYD